MTKKNRLAKLVREIDAQEEEGGDEWIFSYADLITLLLGFFIILYSFSDINEDKFKMLSSDLSDSMKKQKKSEKVVVAKSSTGQERKLRAFQVLVSMIGQENDMEEIVEKIENNEIAKKELESTRKALQDTLGIKAAGKKLGEKEDAMIEIILPYSGTFAPGSNIVNPDTKEKLAELARTVSKIENVVEMEVVGHTDSRPPGANSQYSSNWVLSASRAGAVAEQFVENGMDPKLVNTSGLANLRPLYPEYDSRGTPIVANMEKNRRIQIVIRKRLN